MLYEVITISILNKREMKPVLEIENLGKSFGTKVIFDRISFAVGQNEVLSVIGQSGTGKSVLLKNIMGIIKPDSGSIFVNGKNLYTNSGEIDREILSKMGVITSYSIHYTKLYDIPLYAGPNTAV